MNRNAVEWRGYIPAVTTPFDEDGSLNAAKLGELIEWLVAEGMHGLVAAGTTGEWCTLTNQDRIDLLQTVSDVAQNRIPLIAGCTAFTPEGVVRNAELAAQYGFSGVLVTPPPYMTLSEREVFDFYAEVNAAITLPMCVYNWPPGTNFDMPLSLLSALAELENVVAIKNSTGNFRRFLDAFFALKEDVRIFGVPMNDIGASLVMHHGADGLMGAGGVLGKDQPDFFNRLWDGDLGEALRLGAKDRRIMTDWFNADYTAKFGSAPAVFKEALNVQGLPGGFPRKPVLPLKAEHREIVRQSLTDLGKC